MISVHDLPFYCTQLELAITNNMPIMKKRIELRGRLHKCKSKTKRKKLLQEYRNVKSLCLGLMYGRSVFPNESLTSIGRFAESTEKQVNRLQRLGLVHRTPMSSCDISNMQFNFENVEESVDEFLQNKHKFIQEVTSNKYKSEFEKKCYSALAKAGLVENYNKGGDWETIVIKECNREKARAIIKEVGNSIIKETLSKYNQKEINND